MSGFVSNTTLLVAILAAIVSIVGAVLSYRASNNSNRTTSILEVTRLREERRSSFIEAMGEYMSLAVNYGALSGTKVTTEDREKLFFAITKISLLALPGENRDNLIKLMFHKLLYTHGDDSPGIVKLEDILIEAQSLGDSMWLEMSEMVDPDA